MLISSEARHYLWKQKVLGEIEIVPGHDERLPERVLVGVGGNSRHLGDQPVNRQLAVFRVVDVKAVVVEGGQRPNDATHDGHGM